MWYFNWFWAMYDLFHKALVYKNVYIQYTCIHILIVSQGQYLLLQSLLRSWYILF
jgi:hypothetical protein